LTPTQGCFSIDPQARMFFSFPSKSHQAWNIPLTTKFATFQRPPNLELSWGFLFASFLLVLKTQKNKKNKSQMKGLNLTSKQRTIQDHVIQKQEHKNYYDLMLFTLW
jgi:hypothetical protein